jgi:MFS family permease
MVVFFLTLYLTQHMGASAGLAGLAMSGYGVGMLAGTLTGGVLSDSLGVFRIQRLSLVSAGVILVSISFMHDIRLVLAAVTLWGFAASALYPANAAATAAVCPPEVRTRGFVLNRLAGNLGATIGPLVGGFLAQHDYRLLFWVDGGTCLLAAAASWWFFPVSRPAPHAAHAGGAAVATPASWWRDSIFLWILAGTFGIALAFSQIFSTYGLYLKSAAGLAESRIGALIAINTAMIVVLQMPLTHATDHLSRTRVTALGAAFLGLGLALTPFSGSTLWLAGTVVVWTVGEMLTLPVLTTLVSLRASASAQGRYQGLFSMSYSLGITVGPVVGTRLYTSLGGRMLWLAVGVVSGIVALAMLALSRRWDGRTTMQPQPDTGAVPA